MNNPYTHLTIFERKKIFLLSSQKISLREIAQTKYEKRKRNCGRNQCLSNPKLWQQVRHLFFDLQWSPEQISNRLKLEKYELQISYSTIYQAIIIAYLSERN